MIVMKFGGSSVRDAVAIERVAAIVAARREEAPVVVVSAIGGTTDRLEEALGEVREGRTARALGVIADLGASHRALIEAAAPGGAGAGAAAILERELSALAARMGAMAALAEVSPRSRDAVLAFGELVAAPIVAAALEERGIPAVALDPRTIVATDDRFGAASPRANEIEERTARVVLPLARGGRVPILGGFVGAAEDGATTTLGRGGSDLSAALLAAAVRACALEFWKDVDGILSADPRIVPEARPVARLSFEEAAELAFLGARVLHPASIAPAVEAAVPVRVRNSHRPAAPGTEIGVGLAAKRGRWVASIAHKRGQVIVNVSSNRMLGAPGFLRRVFGAFDELGISVDHIATSEVNVTVTVGDRARAERLGAALDGIATVTTMPGIGIVSVVGAGLAASSEAAFEVLSALGGAGIRLVTYGGFGANLSVAVGDGEVDALVRRLHDRLFAGEEERHG